jgi:predicted esterase
MLENNAGNVERHTFTAKLDCRYLLHVPEQVDEGTVLVLTLHGYSSNPQTMLQLTSGLVGTRHIIAALQAPNQHYLTQGLPGAESVIGYNWGVKDHWGPSVRLHHEMVMESLSVLRGRFDVPAAKCMLVGFSQPVGLNYRFAATWPEQVRGVIGICGGVPRDWEEEGKYRPVTAAVLHISREEDEFYPPELSMQFAERLRKRAADVEFHMLPGGHRFPSKAKHIVQPWMTRVFGT